MANTIIYSSIKDDIIILYKKAIEIEKRKGIWLYFANDLKEVVEWVKNL